MIFIRHHGAKIYRKQFSFHDDLTKIFLATTCRVYYFKHKKQVARIITTLLVNIITRINPIQMR